MWSDLKLPDPPPLGRVLEYGLPSDELKKLLSPSGSLEPLLHPRTLEGIPLRVRVSGRMVEVYCGFACILAAWLIGDHLRVSAAGYFASQPCADGLFRLWDSDDPRLPPALALYLDSVRFIGIPTPESIRFDPGAELHGDLADDDGLTDEEDAPKIRSLDSWSGVHTVFEIDADPAALPTTTETESDVWTTSDTHWIPLGRPPGITYRSSVEKSTARNARTFREVQEEAVRLLPGDSKKTLTSDGVSKEPDVVGLDQDGNLVMLLLAIGPQSESSIVRAPVTLFQSVNEWSDAFGRMEALLLELRRSAVRDRPDADVPRLSGKLRPILALGRMVTSRNVASNLRRVVRFANARLPSRSLPMEVWALLRGAPTPLYDVSALRESNA